MGEVNATFFNDIAVGNNPRTTTAALFPLPLVLNKTPAAVFFRQTPALLTASILALGSSLVISYTRAKAESLGARLEIGLMQRF